MLFVPPSMPFMAPEAEALHQNTITTDKQIYTIGIDTQVIVSISVSESYVAEADCHNGINEPYVWLEWEYPDSSPTGLSKSVTDGHLSYAWGNIPNRTPGIYTVHLEEMALIEGPAGFGCQSTGNILDTTSFTLTTDTTSPPDTTPPVFLTVPSSQTYVTNNATEIGLGGANYDYGSVTATDDYNNLPVTVSCSLESGSFFPFGTSTVTCTATDAAGNVGTASFTVTVNYTAPQAQLTMNSPNISEFDNFGNWAEPKVKYNPTGSFNFDDFHDTNNLSSCLSVQVLKPDGTEASITYDTACVQHFAYNYNFAGYINDAFNASGWTMKICATDYDACAEQNFTISFAFLDADTTPPSQNYTVYVNQMRGAFVIDADEPGGCAGLTPQTCYSPSEITINVGDSVTWINKDPTNNWYTLVGNWGGLSQGSGNDNACDGPGKLNWEMCGVSGNDRTSWTHTFDQVGTYNYHGWVFQNSAQRPEGVVHVLSDNAPPPSSQVPVISTTTSGVAPVVTVPDNISVSTSVGGSGTLTNSTGTFQMVTFSVTASAADGIGAINCRWDNYAGQQSTSWSDVVEGGQDGSTSLNISRYFSVGTHTVTCTAVDSTFSNISSVGIFTVTVNYTPPADTTPPEEEIVIPSWIKNNAGWWADGQIDDRAFVSGLQWLISNGIMNIPPTVQGAGSDDVIPGWIKNNAGWWADDLIDDRNFVTGLQWLITNGIMIIELE